MSRAAEASATYWPALRTLLMWTVLAAATVLIDTAAVLAWWWGAQSRHAPPLWVLLAATLAVTLVLPVLRGPAERLANRLVYGERADSYAMMSGFVRRMADTMAVDEVMPKLAEATARSSHGARAEVRLWLSEGREQRQVWPPDEQDGTVDVAVPVHHAGDSVGELGVGGPDTDLGRPALDRLVGSAGLALSTVRLTVDLRQRLAQIADTNTELRASQERILRARREQREKVRAELARTVSPCLATAEQSLTDAKDALGGPDIPPSLDRRLSQAENAASEALDALRRLTRGIFPPLLDQAGLAAALTAWADHERLRLRIVEGVGSDLLRELPEVEAALYFCCVTVLSELRDRHFAAPLPLEFDVADGQAHFVLRWPQAEAGSVSGVSLSDAAVRDLRDRTEALGGSIAYEAHLAKAEGRLPLRSEPEQATQAAGPNDPQPERAVRP